MTFQTYDHTHVGPGTFGHIRDWIGQKVRDIGAFYAESGRLAQLAALDNRTLKDIGVHRSELTSFVHNPGDATRSR